MSTRTLPCTFLIICLGFHGLHVSIARLLDPFSQEMIARKGAEEPLERVAGNARQRQARQATTDARRPPAYGGPLGETVPAYEGEVRPLMRADWAPCVLPAWQAPVSPFEKGQVD